MTKLSEKLKNERISNGYSQDFVAKKIGIRRSAIAEIENGTRKVSANELKKFCTLYSKSADSFLDIDAQNNNISSLEHYYSLLSSKEQVEIINYIKTKAEINEMRVENLNTGDDNE